MPTKVALVKCKGYETTEINNSLRRAINYLGGIRKFVKKGNKVLLKINLLSPRPPESAVTTHPSIIEGLITLVREAGGVPAVGDSPGGRLALTELTGFWKISGLAEISKKTGVPLISFEENTVDMETNQGCLYKKFSVTSRLREFDVVISIPKLKTHPLTYITAGVKNTFGFIPGLRKSEFHVNLPDRELFAQMLIDLLLAVHIDLVVLDAVVAMEGNGPASGTPRKVGAILASEDPVALDYVAAQTIGYSDPLVIPTTRAAFERGIFSPHSVELVGDTINLVKVPDFKRLPQDISLGAPKILLRCLKKLTSIRPRIISQFCTLCYRCKENCPVGCIREDKKGNLLVDNGKCIRCFCCQELCNQGAVVIERPFLAKLLAKYFSIFNANKLRNRHTVGSFAGNSQA